MSRRIIAYDDLNETNATPSPYNKPEGRVPHHGAPINVAALDVLEEPSEPPEARRQATLHSDLLYDGEGLHQDRTIEPEPSVDNGTLVQGFALGASHPARFVGKRKPAEGIKKEKAEKKKQKRSQKQAQQGVKREQTRAGANEDGESAGKRKKRKFEESLEHDRVHWDAQGQREYGTVEVQYEDDTEEGAVDGRQATHLTSSHGHEDVGPAPKSSTFSTSSNFQAPRKLVTKPHLGDSASKSVVDADLRSNVPEPGTATARPRPVFEDVLASMFENAEKDISDTETDAGEHPTAMTERREGQPSTTSSQQAKSSSADRTKKNVADKESVVTSGRGSANSSTPMANSKQNGKAAEKPSADTTALLMDADAWDDSVLIDAWDAAMEEYQILNGPEADWKKDPLYKDSIWYRSSSDADLRWNDIKPAKSKDNPVTSTSAQTSASNVQAGPYDEGDHQMENREEEQGQATAGSGTFQAVGAGASVTADQEQQAAAGLPAAFDFDISKMSKDEIFQKAIEASYWAGYWAAAYHASTNTSAAN